MPVREYKTGQTTGYFKWGDSGKRYYYKTLKGKTLAHLKSVKQAIAIHASGWRGK